MAKRQVYSIEDRKYSANSVASTALGFGSVLMIALLLLISFWMKGQAGAWIGAFGVTGILMSILGLRYGMVSFRDDCKSYLCSRVGTIVSTAAIIVWFFIVCVGIVNMM